MNKAAWLVAMLLSSVTVAADAQRVALEAAIHRWTAAVNAQDVATLTATMTEDVELSDNVATVRGRDAAIQSLREMLKRGKLSAVSFEITVANEIAWHEAGLTQTEKNGDVHARGQALEIWKRVKGEWRLHRRVATGGPGPEVSITRPSPNEPVLDGSKTSNAGHAVEEYLLAARAGLDARVTETLDKIEGTGRQLLALRSYVRSAAQLDERWSWNDAQISAYAVSPEKARLEAAIARVRCRFESANPGHTLYVNENIRSLDQQIEKWNRSETIHRSADNLLETLRAEVDAAAFPKASTPEGVTAFRNFLVSFKPTPTPSLAAPGLSLHGRMQALDFQVMAGNRLVAGTEVSSVTEAWVTTGWKAKLQSAVKEANVGFVGPLKIPDEPWHYDFRPVAGTEAVSAQPGCSSAPK